MKRVLFASAVTLVALLALAAPAVAQVDLSGEWAMSVIDADNTPTLATLSIEQSGSGFAGTVASDAGEVDFTGGTISGDSITFVFGYDDGGGEYISAEVEAAVDGDEMAGEVHVVGTGGRPFTADLRFTATRGG